MGQRAVRVKEIASGFRYNRDVKEAFEAFLEKSTLDSYYALRDAVVSHAQFNPYSDELARLNTLCADEDFQEMQVVMQGMLPNCLMSPSFHIFAGLAAKGLGDEKTAELQSQVARRFLLALLETGDGSEEDPYHIVRIEDEYDVMAANGREVAGQEMLEENGRYFDVLTDTDGRKIWFDVTIPRTYLERTLAAGGDPEPTL